MIRPQTFAALLAVAPTCGGATTSAATLYVTSGTNSILTYDTTATNPTPTTFTSTGLNQPFGLAFDAASNIYAANLGDRTIEKFTPGGVASLFVSTGDQPNGLAFDRAGNLYVSTEDNLIQKFTPGGVGSVFASTSLSVGGGVAIDAAGNIYSANGNNSTIEKFTPGGVGKRLRLNGAGREDRRLRIRRCGQRLCERNRQ